MVSFAAKSIIPTFFLLAPAKKPLIQGNHDIGPKRAKAEWVVSGIGLCTAVGKFLAIDARLFFQFFRTFQKWWSIPGSTKVLTPCRNRKILARRKLVTQ
jgi:hypothetical protein